MKQGKIGFTKKKEKNEIGQIEYVLSYIEYNRVCLIFSYEGYEVLYYAGTIILLRPGDHIQQTIFMQHDVVYFWTSGLAGPSRN